MPEPEPGPEPQTEPQPEPATPEQVWITLTAPGHIVVRWGSDPSEVLLEGDLTGDIAERDRTLERLRAVLAERSDSRREPDGSSRVKVTIQGDRTARWNMIQHLMTAMAHPTVRIYKIHIAVRGPGD